MNIDYQVLFTTVAGTGLVALGALIIRAIRSLDRLIFLIDGEKPPGVLIRLGRLEEELQSIREWALARGYDRRHDDNK